MSLYAFLALTVLIEELYVRAHLSNSSKIYALFFIISLQLYFFCNTVFPLICFAVVFP